MAEDEVGHGGRVVEVEAGQGQPGECVGRRVGGDGDDGRVVRVEQRAAVGRPVDLDLGMDFAPPSGPAELVFDP